MFKSYSDIPAISSITTESDRLYMTPDGDFPSVTTILSATSYNPFLEKWKENVGFEEAERIRKEATDKGSLVHEALEQILQTGDHDYIKDYPRDLKLTTINMLQFVKKYNIKILAQEMPLWHKELKYAGRCDAVGIVSSKRTLIDWKTAKKKKPEAWVKDYKLQCSAYVLAHNDLFEEQIEQFLIVIGVFDGTVQHFVGNPAHFIPEFKKRVRQFYEQQKQK